MVSVESQQLVINVQGFGEKVELIKYYVSLYISGIFCCLPVAYSFSNSCKLASQYLPLFLFLIYLQITFIVYWPADLFGKICKWKQIIIYGDNKVSQEGF